jgi:sporulation protein YlmC with PRC-barrel domain
MGMSTAAGAGSFLVEAPVAGRQTLGAATADLVDASIPLGATVEDESNLEPDDDLIGAGTDVVASDGRRVGTVHEVTYGADGSITGFVVKAGVLFKHDVHIPAASVATMGAKHIHLNVTAEHAEAAGRS